MTNLPFLWPSLPCVWQIWMFWLIELHWFKLFVDIEKFQNNPTNVMCSQIDLCVSYWSPVCDYCIYIKHFQCIDFGVHFFQNNTNLSSYMIARLGMDNNQLKVGQYSTLIFIETVLKTLVVSSSKKKPY